MINMRKSHLLLCCRQLKIPWIISRLRKRAVYVTALVMLGSYMYWSNNIVYSINRTDTQQRFKRQLNWWALPYNESNGFCFHKTWHYFVTNVTRNWPGLALGKPAGNLTGEARDEVTKLVKRVGANCRQILEAGQMTRPVVYSVVRSDPDHNEVVTLVTQLGHNRFDSLQLILDTWQAGISATIYVSSEETMSFLKKLCDCKALQSRSNVDIHVVLKHGDFYPLNYLRNVALNGTKTELAYLSDVDFVPSKGTDRLIKQIWQENKSFFDKNVLVIPAFEMLHKHVPVPRNKTELIHLLDRGSLIPAREKKWPKGHMPTDYEKWRKVNNIYTVKYSEYYEPYIVIKTSATPRYSHLFVERYRDKGSQLLEVWAKGFQYQVLASSYAIHYPHNYTAIGTTQTLYKCAKDIYKVFLEELKKQYNISSIPQFES